ncbi:MAG TPA: triphosphoribosyl-dephospho-CoA synthase [Anaerolineae bacterium]|nr:triphosphoribosyl-dephospho-CoA synthase [Anaerolineae bacterium]HMR67775.1 triphosphoribosyl-dephospho-CoA synthase [Anaerolineae bacterium]
MKQRLNHRQPETTLALAAPCWAAETVAQAAQLACLLEVSAEKPGNVTPSYAFSDMSYEDFLRSAVAIGPELGRAGERRVGETILAAITATRRWTAANTNLGIVLLLAPLARAALSEPPPLRAGLSRVLADLSVYDAQQSYRAIRLAAPGGLGDGVAHDVHVEPAVTLGQAMYSARERDSVAAEYTSDYALTFELGLPALQAAMATGLSQRLAVVQVYLEILAAIPDTLIARKRGRSLAESVTRQAQQVVKAGGVHTAAGRQAVADFDLKLRQAADNSLNPGTTADLVAAVLFVALLSEQGSSTE